MSLMCSLSIGLSIRSNLEAFIIQNKKITFELNYHFDIKRKKHRKNERVKLTSAQIQEVTGARSQA